jgi:hypothetical protein
MKVLRWLGAVVACVVLVGCSGPPKGGAEDESLRVKGDLTVHAKGSGPPKGHPGEGSGSRYLYGQHFQLSLVIENLSNQPKTLAKPTIDAGRLTFSVMRWYDDGSNGEDWDGALMAQETRKVNVIGSVEGRLEPGDSVTATVSLGGLKFKQSTQVQEGIFAKCPCGCDRSAQRIEELRRMGGQAAIEAIDQALATIAERVSKGYVAEQMIAHRLRLLALADEIRKGR